MMIELQDKELMLARGQYSTLNAERRGLLKQLQEMGDQVVSLPHKILKAAQEDAAGASAQDLIGTIVSLGNMMGGVAMRLEELDKQRAELKPIAWPK
jgi:hypothetical protein